MPLITTSNTYKSNTYKPNTYKPNTYKPKRRQKVHISSSEKEWNLIHLRQIEQKRAEMLALDEQNEKYEKDEKYEKLIDHH
jgi:hypothetical protein